MASTVSYFEDHSETSSSEDEPTEQPVRKQRRPNRLWQEKEKYASAAEAENAVEQQKIWQSCSVKETANGRRVEYRCVKGQYRKAECSKGLYLLYHSTSMYVSLYETLNDHDNHSIGQTRGLSEDLKDFIQKKYADGITKPNALLHLVRQNGMVEPPKTQVIGFLTKLRQKKGTPSASTSEIRTWCNERIQIPQDEDEPYVIGFVVFAESYNSEDQDLKIVMSTPRLLKLAKNHPKLAQTDATYKLNWHGYPFLLVGTSDANRVFHPFAVALTKGETQEDFAFIFQEIYKAVPEWKPSILLADGAEAITNGFTVVFGSPEVRLMCFYHMKTKSDSHLRLVSNVDYRSQLEEDINVLQTAPNEKTFKKASALFLKKWKNCKDNEVIVFVTYLEKEWFISQPNWYEGAARGFPSTNNGVEATNSIIKSEHTLRERLPIGQFLNCSMDMVKKWSQRRDPKSVNCVFFNETPSISLELWTQAYQWVAQKIPVLQRDTDGRVEYFCSSSKTQTPITAKLLQDFERQEGKWKTFDNFSTWRSKIWKIEVYPDRVVCSCPIFTKKNQCKHSIGMLIKRKEVDVPEEAKNIPLGQKRKRGRPSKAKKALLK